MGDREKRGGGGEVREAARGNRASGSERLKEIAGGWRIRGAAVERKDPSREG